VIGAVGLDVIDVARVRALLADKGDRALRRLFTDHERRYCETRPEPERHFAARLAAKEAAFKALSGSDEARAISWTEIEVRIDEHGRPTLALHRRAAQRAEELRARALWLSLTHSDHVAAAVVVLDLLE
jgi:holo-[acyl-carrier protein] synthase